MRDNPTEPGGPLTSKPAWPNTHWGSATPAFFSQTVVRDDRDHQRLNRMDQSNATLAQQIAQAASAFERRRTGHGPRSVTVVLGADTLVITLHGALSPAETALASSPAGAARVQEFHRQLFATTSEELRQEIKRITGVE